MVVSGSCNDSGLMMKRRLSAGLNSPAHTHTHTQLRCVKGHTAAMVHKPMHVHNPLTQQ
jgi:hypothetical protein